MLLYDAWVNWSDGMLKAHGIPEYHEWKKEDDNVELLNAIPIVKVTSELFYHILDNFTKVPGPLLKEVYRKASRARSNTKETIDHAFVMTDGCGVAAVECEDFLPMRKSRLIPRQDRQILECMENEEAKSYGFVAPEKIATTDTLVGRILSIEPVHMIGLTRRERGMKEILMDSLYQLATSESREEVHYWYLELFWGMKDDPTVEDMTIEQMVHEMHDYLQDGWDEEHVTFGAKLAKYFDNYEDMWKKLEIDHLDTVG